MGILKEFIAEVGSWFRSKNDVRERPVEDDIEDYIEFEGENANFKSCNNPFHDGLLYVISGHIPEGMQLGIDALTIKIILEQASRAIKRDSEKLERISKEAQERLEKIKHMGPVVDAAVAFIEKKLESPSLAKIAEQGRSVQDFVRNSGMYDAEEAANLIEAVEEYLK